MWNNLTASDLVGALAFLLVILVLVYVYRTVCAELRRTQEVRQCIPRDFMYVPPTDVEVYSYLTQEEMAVTTPTNVVHVMRAIARANLKYVDNP